MAPEVPSLMARREGVHVIAFRDPLGDARDDPAVSSTHFYLAIFLGGIWPLTRLLLLVRERKNWLGIPHILAGVVGPVAAIWLTTKQPDIALTPVQCLAVVPAAVFTAFLIWWTASSAKPSGAAGDESGQLEPGDDGNPARCGRNGAASALLAAVLGLTALHMTHLSLLAGLYYGAIFFVCCTAGMGFRRCLTCLSNASYAYIVGAVTAPFVFAQTPNLEDLALVVIATAFVLLGCFLLFKPFLIVRVDLVGLGKILPFPDRSTERAPRLLGTHLKDDECLRVAVRLSRATTVARLRSLFSKWRQSPHSHYLVGTHSQVSSRRVVPWQRHSPLPPGPERTVLDLELQALARFSIQHYLSQRDSDIATPLPDRESPSDGQNAGHWAQVRRELLMSVRLHSLQLFIYMLLLATTFAFVALHVELAAGHRTIGPFVAGAIFVLWAAVSLFVREGQIRLLRLWAREHQWNRRPSESPVFVFRSDRPDDQAWEELVNADFHARVETFGLNHVHAVELIHAALLLTALELAAILVKGL